MRRSVPLILLVDDDEAMVAALTEWLFRQGFNAVAASSCLEARAVIEAIPIDGMLGQLALKDGSLFDVAGLIRPRPVIGYAAVTVKPPPELDACFALPLDFDILGQILGVRFGRRPSGQLPKVVSERLHSVPAKRHSS